MHTLQVRVTKGKLASGSIVPRPEILRLRRVPKPLPGALFSVSVSIILLLCKVQRCMLDGSHAMMIVSTVAIVLQGRRTPPWRWL
jgi:hypothetical protein